jgi:hypothetical protein
MPRWDEVPGGTFYREESDFPDDEPEDTPVSNVLPRLFRLIRDDEWEDQVSKIQTLFEDDLLGEDVTELSAADIRRMQQEVLASIADRGTDRARCILTRLFENSLKGIETAPSWKDLWKECWTETIDTRRGADSEQSQTVRQAVYRAREVLDRYFATEAGQRWPSRAVIGPNDYRIRFVAPSTGPLELPFEDSAPEEE